MERDGSSVGATTAQVGLELWNDGPAKAAIMDFVSRVSMPGHPDFVPRPERIATFDNDGTLWCEHPMQVQVYFAHQRLAALAQDDPELRSKQPYKAYLEHDLEAMRALGKRGLFEIAALTHAGMTDEEFSLSAHAWLADAEHPQLHRPFRKLVYAPQLELLGYLRNHGFKTFIVTGGGIDFVRVLAEEVYDIPSEQVIGSSVRTSFEMRHGRGELVKLPELDSFDDREAKPHNIGLHIGRRPILAFGNSDGDLAMLRYVLTGDGPRLGLLLHHDDAGREFAYDRDFRLSPLDEALDHAGEYAITLVSMKADWNQVFPEPART